MMVTHTMMADGPVSKYTVVCMGRFDNTVMTAVWPDKNMVSNIIGLALNDTGDGGNVEVCLMGPVTDPSFYFTRSKPIYIVDSGRLTQTMPIRSIYSIGKAIAEKTILVMPSQFFLLES